MMVALLILVTDADRLLSLSAAVFLYKQESENSLQNIEKNLHLPQLNGEKKCNTV